MPFPAVSVTGYCSPVVHMTIARDAAALGVGRNVTDFSTATPDYVCRFIAVDVAASPTGTPVMTDDTAQRRSGLTDIPRRVSTETQPSLPMAFINGRSRRRYFADATMHLPPISREVPSLGVYGGLKFQAFARFEDARVSCISHASAVGVGRNLFCAGAQRRHLFPLCHLSSVSTATSRRTPPMSLRSSQQTFAAIAAPTRRHGINIDDRYGARRLPASGRRHPVILDDRQYLVLGSRRLLRGEPRHYRSIWEWLR